MHVGFYLDTTHLGAWDWTDVLQDAVPLSGTDGSVLRIAHELAAASPLTVTLFAPTLGTSPASTPAAQVAVDGLPDAVNWACARGLDVLVLLHAPGDALAAGLQQAERRGLPCIAWCQNGPSRRWADRYTASPAVRRVLCVSHAHADTYRDKPVFDKIAVIYNPVAIGRRGTQRPAPTDSRMVCYVGAITSDKGLHHLIRAWPSVRTSFPEACLRVVGSAQLYDRQISLGPLGMGRPTYERTHLIPVLGRTREEAAERHGIVLEGLLPPDRVRTVMEAALVGVVNPNTRRSLETFCVTAVEMQAAGTAVVGARRKGLRETVCHGETGMLIRRQWALAPTLRRLLANPAKARRLGRHGQQWVAQTFDLEAVVARWHALLEAVAAGRPPAPLPFSLRRATPRTALRESIRRLHWWAGPGRRIRLLDRLLEAVRR